MNQLKLHVSQRYDLRFHCIDDNYDGAPDGGRQKEGDGLTPLAAVIDYLENNEHDLDVNYVISGKDLIG